MAKRKWQRLAVLMALVPVLSQCSGIAEYKDVSNDPRYNASVFVRPEVLAPDETQCVKN